MINLLHTFQPQAILISFGPITLYWYGLLMVISILGALTLSFYLARYYHISTETVFDLAFWLIINGLIGARIYDDLLQLPYYINHPLQSLQIWKGGLAIHGAIIAGLITVIIFAKRRKLSFWKLTAIFVPGLALAQSIGRWGNYFNQEIFGLPTSWPWGIPIDLINRPINYISESYFHPTFLYESLGCLLISAILLLFSFYNIKRNHLNELFYTSVLVIYMVLYSILRFFLEFIRLDETPGLFGLRWPQVVSLIIIILSNLLIAFKYHARPEKNS